ncbi:branched-chain amino acid transporter permease [Streptomyces harbinensis]|uniref:branched-chain amino acid transporter permease n=1 Tax=Streptomyces TaxID=1883 RepID=UPI0002F29C46|nr:AzlD domain-containing protein [Streptomyces sp. AA0539]
MPSTSYLLGVLALVFSLTLALRAVPFAVLRTLRGSVIVQRLAVWMPVGIMAILAVTSLRSTVVAVPGTLHWALVAVAVTVGVHLAAGRRTILSVGIGTAVYVVLVNAW